MPDPSPGVPHANMPYAKKFIEIDGQRLAYVDEGQGDPIVLLHGWIQLLYMLLLFVE